MTPKEIPTLLIDGYGFVFRAYHVQPPLTSPGGEPVGALYGFTSMLLKLLSDFKPVKCAIVFDSGGKNHRHELYPEYKAHRPPPPEDLKSQLPLVRFAASALNFAIIEQNGFEADDLIATMALNLSARGEKVVIVSSDKDLMQLIDENILMYDPVKAKYIDAAVVHEKFGVGPEKVREVLALIGDSSDNIPGAPGIGPKGAAELIAQFGSLENILNSAEQIKQDKKREIITNYKDQIMLSFELVGLKSDIDIKNQDLNWQSPDRHTLSEFIAKYGFKSLLLRAEKLFGMDLEHSDHQVATEISEITISNTEELNKLLERVQRNGFLSLCLNNNTLQLAENTKESFVIHDFLDNSKNIQADLFSAAKARIDFTNLWKIFADPSVKKITFDLKKHMHLVCSLVIPGLDPRIQDYDAKHHRSNMNNMDPRVKPEDDEKKGSNNDTFTAFEDLALMHYAVSAGLSQASLEEFLTLNPITSFKQKYEESLALLKANSALSIYYDIDLPISKILFDMEVRGVKIDPLILAEMSGKFAHEIGTLEQKIFAIAGVEFNIGSPKQLGEILFDKMQLPAGKMSAKSKTYSTGAEVLEKLSESGIEIADLILRWRMISKLKSTYTDSLPKQINPKTGRVHTNFIQNLTSTSRLSSQDPNLQNIPIRSDEGAQIRTAFIADKNHKLISADYSQIELRLLSHIAEIPSLIKAFNEGKDIHSITAMDIFHIKENELTAEHRRKAKAINFGIIYGISRFGLAKQLGINRVEAAKYIDLYFEKYPGIKDYMDKTKEFARAHGYALNMFGRKCMTPLINDRNFSLRSFAERAAINAPLQGGNADIIKLAMIALDKIFKTRELKTKMILQVHDELIFEAPDDEVDIVAPLIKQTMQNICSLKVPLTVGITIGQNWGKE